MLTWKWSWLWVIRAKAIIPRAANPVISICLSPSFLPPSPLSPSLPLSSSRPISHIPVPYVLGLALAPCQGQQPVWEGARPWGLGWRHRSMPLEILNSQVPWPLWTKESAALLAQDVLSSALQSNCFNAIDFYRTLHAIKAQYTSFLSAQEY